MTNNPLQPFASLSMALSSAPGVFAYDAAAADQFGKGRIVRVWSNRQFHVAIGDGATTDSLPVAAGGEGALIHVDPGEDISVIKGASETDGSIWFTTVKRY
jgi:hypothetical protein